MGILKTTCSTIAVFLILVAIGFSVSTQCKIIRYEEGIDEAWEAFSATESFRLDSSEVKDALSRIDQDWLGWLAKNGGFSCYCFVVILQDAKYEMHTSPYLCPALGPRLLKDEIIGNGWNYSAGALLSAIILLIVPRCCWFYYRRNRRLCTRCGYNIQHLVEKRCPECGKSFSDDVFGATKPSLIKKLYQHRVFRRGFLVLVFGTISFLAGVKYWRQYAFNKKIERYSIALREADNISTESISKIVNDDELTDSDLGIEMLLGVLVDEQVSLKVRYDLATQMVENYIKGTDEVLVQRYLASNNYEEKKQIIEVLGKTIYWKVVRAGFKKAIIIEKDAELRRMLAIWFIRNVPYVTSEWTNEMVALKKLFDAETVLKTKIAIAGAIRQCDLDFAEEWLEKTKEEYRDKENQEIYNYCRNALDYTL